MKIAFIGLGVMGAPIAGHLAENGHELAVYNRTPAKAEQWAKKYKGRICASPAEAAQGADFAFSCVGNDADVQAVTIGAKGDAESGAEEGAKGSGQGDAKGNAQESVEGAFATLPRGAIFIDHTTTSAKLATTLFQTAKQAGFSFLDAPVSGGEAGAQAGQLTIMLGGEQQAYEKAKPILETYARAHRLMGGAGAGQLTKMVNQIAIAGLVQGLAEALHFARCAGLDEMAVIDVISKGAAQSWQMDNRHKTMIAGEFDFGFAVDLMRKDLAIVFDEAKQNNASLAITKQVDEFYAKVQQLGGGRWDTSSLIALLQNSKPRA